MMKKLYFLNFKIKCFVALSVLAFILSACFNATNNSASPEIRHITPPKLEKAHLGKKTLCHRPMRTGAPQMTIESQATAAGKIIAHNYGHGGSGWTLGPGSASYVNNLLLTQEKDLKKNTPITVLGGGALGLFTAYDLINKGYTNITIVAEKFDNLTSHNSGGLLAPVSMDNSPDMQKLITQIGVDAYNFYASIAKGQHKDFKNGAVIVPTYFENREDSGLEPYITEGVMQPSKDVILDFGTGTKRQMVAYDDGIFIDTAIMMVNLTAYLKGKGVTFKKQKIKSFDNIKDQYIINCSGLGAGQLNNDKDMISVQGHLIMLKDQNPADLQHMILVYFDKATTASGQNVKRSFYMFPKHLEHTGPNDVGVIGGTFIEGATAKTPNNEEFDIMLQGAKDFYGIKK